MARFSLDASIRPTVDSGAAEQQADELAGTFEQRLGDLEVGTDGGGGVGALGGARAGGGGGGIGGATTGAGIVGAARGGSIASAAGAALPVALAGATAFGILQGVQKLGRASPALQQTNEMFSEAMSLFLRPWGNALSGFIRPWATAALNMAIQFNDLYSKSGLGVAILGLSSDIEESWASAVGDNVEGALGTVGIETDIGGDISNFLQDVNWTRVLTSGPGGAPAAFGNEAARVVGGWLEDSLPNISVSNIIGNIGWPTIAAGSLLGVIGFPALSATAVVAEVFGDVNLTTEDVLDELLGGGGAGGGGGGEGGGGPLEGLPPWLGGPGNPARPPRRTPDDDPDINDEGIIDRLDTLIREQRRTRERFEAIDESIIENGRDESLDPFL